MASLAACSSRCCRADPGWRSKPVDDHISISNTRKGGRHRQGTLNRHAVKQAKHSFRADPVLRLTQPRQLQPLASPCGSSTPHASSSAAWWHHSCRDEGPTTAFNYTFSLLSSAPALLSGNCVASVQRRSCFHTFRGRFVLPWL